MSTVNFHFLTKLDDTLVIAECHLPELHLIQEFINHIFWKGILLILVREKVIIILLSIYFCPAPDENIFLS